MNRPNFLWDLRRAIRNVPRAIFAYENDHPEVFWLDNKYDYILTDGMTSLSLYYIMSNTELEQAKETLEQKAENIVSSAPQNAGEFELEEYINDYLCENCEYDYDSYGSNGDLTSSSGNESTAYGALIDGKALCEGYSRAFQLLCNKLGIECVNVFGESKDVLSSVELCSHRRAVVSTRYLRVHVE